jgi:beta-N-acetylhexosaminidase
MRVITRMDGAAATPDLLRRARRGEIGGVIVFPGGADGRALASAIDRLQAAARDGGGPGLLVSTDQEGGSVKRFPAGPPGRAPGEMGSAGAAEQEGAATGEYLARLGINVDLAPVLDVPSVGGAFIASRAFGTTARDVALRGIAFAQGLAGAGVAGAAKHFPGLGSATANTDLQRSVISADARSLEAQLRPFRLAVDAAIPMVMVSSAVYSGYDRARPAVLSPRVVRRLLRRRLGFDGVVITDDLSSPAIASATTPAEAAVAFARAGGDVALYARVGTASDAGHDALLSAARAKRIPRSQLRASYRRIVALIELLGR